MRGAGVTRPQFAPTAAVVKVPSPLLTTKGVCPDGTKTISVLGDDLCLAPAGE